MKWSRSESRIPGDRIELEFPNGVQARLDLHPPSDDKGDAQPSGSNDGPRKARRLDLPPANARALIAWQMLGIHLFLGNRRPSLAEAVSLARSVVLAMELELEDENITRMALELGASRRAVREQLKKAGLYDLARSETDDGEDEDEPAAELVEEARIDG